MLGRIQGRLNRRIVTFLSFAAVLMMSWTAGISPATANAAGEQVPAHTIPAAWQLRVLKDFGLTSYRDAIPHAKALPVKGRAPKTGYKRSLYGTAWTDNADVLYGHNGCRTREDILQRDLVAVRMREGSNCIVESGLLLDPYTAEIVYFVRGPQTSAEVQIDHVVALSDSWQKGAQQWEFQKRVNFANDPRNLIAVSGYINQQKGASDTATWLPPNKAYRCEYVTRQVEVKRVYGLWVTQAEQDAMVRELSKCC
ncbi:MAG TPA: HNH endonuclease [Corynebacteriales bacterium]|nr:HNH endonuclease [Mycobacteriales bacterium]